MATATACCTVLHGDPSLQSLPSSPVASTNTASSGAAQRPSSARQMPLAHSLSAWHVRQAPAAWSHTGVVASQYASLVHATHAPSASHAGAPSTPTQSSSTVQNAVHASAWQYGAIAGHVELSAHVASMQAPSVHTKPSPHAMGCGNPTSAQSSADTQHTAGLGLVQAAPPSTTTIASAPTIRGVVIRRAYRCARLDRWRRLHDRTPP